MLLYCPFKAQELRPSDSRMLVALGESYEKLDKIQVRNEYIYHNFMGQFSDMDIFCSSTYNIYSVFFCMCFFVIAYELLKFLLYHWRLSKCFSGTVNMALKIGMDSCYWPALL